MRKGWLGCGKQIQNNYMRSQSLTQEIQTRLGISRGKIWGVQSFCTILAASAASIVLNPNSNYCAHFTRQTDEA